MCGRFVRASPREALVVEFGVEPPAEPALAPRYNVCPGEDVLALAGAGAARRFGWLGWGLVPAFARDPAAGPRSINARAETLLVRPAFRDAFRRRRCLIVADGFYEWRREGRARTPYLARLRSRRPFAFAGLWERWRGAGTTHTTCAIITCPANATLAAIHDRMPVIVPPAARDAWLARDADPDALRALLVPYPEDELEVFAVSPLVNSPRHDSPECIRPA